MLTFFSRVIRLFLVMVMLVLVMVSGTAAIVPQIASLKGAVKGEAYGDISLAALDIRSEVFDSEGVLIHRFRRDGSNRELLEFDDFPEEIITAVVTIEDDKFFQHRGINLRATFRALVENVGAGGISQGGSTISQQLVKTRVLRTTEQTMERKVREAVLSLRLEDRLEKEEILTWYLNTVYFGSGAYGVQAASEVYFGKNAADLEWDEAALLASLIRQPGQTDPFINPSEALRQRNIALRRLVQVGAIDQEDARFYSRKPLPQKRNVLVDLPPEDFFVAEVRRQFLNGTMPANPTPELLAVIGETPESRADALYSGGLRIYTTYDRKAQQEALRARDEVVPDNDRGFTASIASVEPGTGAVRVLVGGDDFDPEKQAFNLATQGDRQPGSSFKTFVLITALESGYVPSDYISGTGPCQFPDISAEGGFYKVQNFANSGGSVNTLLHQTTSSSNCAYVRLGQVVGIPKVIATSAKLGIDIDPIRYNVKSLPLGVAEVRPIEVAAAYAAIANGGVRHDPFYIERIEDAQGNVLYKHQSAGERVLSAQVACLTTEVLKANVEAGTGTRAQVKDQPAAGKTGTTEDFSDAWFVGYTPQLATSVWMGNPEGNEHQMTNLGGRNVTGGSFPAQAWGQFMNAYHADLEREDFPVCAETRPGRLIREDGELASANPCSEHPGYLPVDANSDGEVDFCSPNPQGAGYHRCGAVETQDGLLDRYCGHPGQHYSTISCAPGTEPVDIDNDGIDDICAPPGWDNPYTKPAEPSVPAVVCSPGSSAKDTDGDGIVDTCVADVVEQVEPYPGCPNDYPYGVDTTGDGNIDSCSNVPQSQ